MLLSHLQSAVDKGALSNAHGHIDPLLNMDMLQRQVTTALEYLKEHLKKFLEDEKTADAKRPILPEKLAVEKTKSMMMKLNAQIERVKTLKLSVCLIGPAKSGKSYTVNAIMGAKIAPSHTHPCTVMPTVIRHVKGRKNFTLILDEKVIKTFDDAVDQVLSKKDELLDPL